MKRSDRIEAIRLRREGATYAAILRRFGMAKSTLWRWLKAAGMVETHAQRLTDIKRAAQQKGAATMKAKRLSRMQTVLELSRKDVGQLSRRDLWVLGLALYWAEGTKQKPHNISQRVQFSNSDPDMVRVFMRWLHDCCGVDADRVTLELYIHESGNIEAAKKFWLSTLQVPLERFRVRLKKHKISTRRNTGANYVGLVRVSVSQSADLNRWIAGWVQGIVQNFGESSNGRTPDFGSGYPGSIPGSPVSFTGSFDGADTCEDAPRNRLLCRFADTEVNA